MKKLNMIFDASILAENDSHTSVRSGIFFTALNILKELQRAKLFSWEKCTNKIISTIVEKSGEVIYE